MNIIDEIKKDLVVVVEQLQLERQKRQFDKYKILSSLLHELKEICLSNNTNDKLYSDKGLIRFYYYPKTTRVFFKNLMEDIEYEMKTINDLKREKLKTGNVGFYKDLLLSFKNLNEFKHKIESQFLQNEELAEKQGL